MQSCRTEFAVKRRKLRRSHGLIQHLSDDLLLDCREQRSVFLGGRRPADGLKENRQQLLLLSESKDIGPVHVRRRAVSTGDRRFDERNKLCFSRRKGHHGVSCPFLMFFHDVGDHQRGRADKRTQRVADHVIRLRHTKGIVVLGVLNDGAQQTGKERCNTNAHPSAEPLWERVGERQPQGEEEEYVHQHFAVKLRLLLGSGKGGKDRGAAPRLYR